MSTHLFVIDLQNDVALIQLLAVVRRPCPSFLLLVSSQGSMHRK